MSPSDLAATERALMHVARSILRLGVPEGVLEDGTVLDKAGYWLLFRIAEEAPLRPSELAQTLELDLSTVSRQVKDLAVAGLLEKTPDPDDGRAFLVDLTERGQRVLESVSEARRAVIAEAMEGWSEEERHALYEMGDRLMRGLDKARSAQRDARHDHQGRTTR